MRSIALLDSGTRSDAFLASKKHAGNNSSKHWYPVNSSRFCFYTLNCVKRIPGAEHACKPANSGEGDRLIVMHAHLFQQNLVQLLKSIEPSIHLPKPCFGGAIQEWSWQESQRL